SSIDSSKPMGNQKFKNALLTGLHRMTIPNPGAFERGTDDLRGSLSFLLQDIEQVLAVKRTGADQHHTYKHRYCKVQVFHMISLFIRFVFQNTGNFYFPGDIPGNDRGYFYFKIRYGDHKLAFKLH